MHGLGAAVGVLVVALTSAAPSVPLRPGQYQFEHRFSEHPSIASITLVATVSETGITLRNLGPEGVFPHGVVAEGMLRWHAESRQWIIATSEADATAIEVGGCSEGPEVVDLERRIYWTC